MLVKAETGSQITQAQSDGVIVIDDTANLEVINVYDGEPCTRDTGIEMFALIVFISSTIALNKQLTILCSSS